MADGSGVDITEDVPISDFSKYLLDRVKQLEERNVRLKEEYRKIELEKKSVENKKVQYERENRKLTAELDRLKTPPLLVGTVLDIMGNNKLVIKSSSGPKFVVNSSQFINSKDIYAGAKVALNQQSLAVIEVLPPVKDPMVLGMEVIEAPNIDYNNIGGLEDQIKELKEAVELPLLKPELFEKVGIEPPEGCSCMARRALVKRCSPRLWRTAPMHRSSGSSARNWCRNTLEKVLAWYVSCLSWPRKNRPRSYSSTRSTLSGLRGLTASPPEIVRCSVP